MTNSAEKRPSPNELIGSTATEITDQNRKQESNASMTITKGKSSPGRSVAILLVAILVVGSLVASGIIPRLKAQKALAAETSQLAAPTVTVVQARRGAPTQEIVLPGNIQAFVDAPIYARTNGYLKRWYFDIGSPVKKGQLLAEIETPEVDQQLFQARSDLETAQANYNIAKITASRWEFLVSTGSVSQQETDQAKSDLAAKKSAADSSASNVRRLEELRSFEKIYA